MIQISTDPNIDIDEANGLYGKNPTIYHINNLLYIGYLHSSADGKKYGAQLKIGHWLSTPQYRTRTGNNWNEWKDI